MATHIKVDVDELSSLATNLDKLYDDFHDVPQAADDILATIGNNGGSSSLRDAVGDFASNWKIRRGRLLESIDAVREMAKESHKSFSKVDLDLANQILGHG